MCDNEELCGNYGRLFLSLSLVCFLCRLILDHINRFEKRRDISKSLGDEWSRNTKLKHQQKEEDRRFLRCVSVQDTITRSILTSYLTYIT